MKKMHRDRLVEKRNDAVRRKLKKLVKGMRTSPSKKELRAAYHILDTAAKVHVIHANKAARLKSRLARLLKKK